MLMMEFSFGQYFGVGSLSIFKHVCPLFKGQLAIHNRVVNIWKEVTLLVNSLCQTVNMVRHSTAAVFNNNSETSDLDLERRGWKVDRRGRTFNPSVEAQRYMCRQ